jgi:hypothetical protein
MADRISISYQIALIDSTYRMQTILTNVQGTNSEAGSLASSLLDQQYNLSAEVLDENATIVNDIAEEGEENDWEQEYVDAYNAANQVYQNDTLVCETGQSNASNAVQRSQTQVAQDGTNLSNLITLAGTIGEIGRFMSGLLTSPYT